MRMTKIFFAAAIFCISASALAQTLEKPNETVTGEELFVVCGFCHGSSGQGSRRRDGPALAGLPAWYLELQMRNYIDGVRGTHPEDIPGQIMYYSTGMLRNDYTLSLGEQPLPLPKQLARLKDLSALSNCACCCCLLARPETQMA